MRDPFKPHTNHQLVREAQFGFTVIGLLVATLIYVAWFRLNGLDRTPDNVRSSPIAMQVYPNSPNYDSDSHQMVDPAVAPPRSADLMSNQSQKPLVSNPLAEVPRKMMTDSQRTARRLSQDATSIDRSVTKVATLLKPTKLQPTPVAIEPIKKVVATPKLEPGFGVPKKEPLMLPPTPTKTMTIKPLVGLPSAKPATARKSNDFKPLKPQTDSTAKPVATEVKPNLFSPFKRTSTIAPATATTPAKATLPPLPSFPNHEPAIAKPKPASPLATSESRSLPSIPSPEPREITPQKLTPQAFPPLRPTKPTPQPSRAFDASAATKTPNVQMVSFESTTWKVKKGDSFWSIAQQSYGDGRFFRALYESNRKLVPGFENLREDLEINIPSEQQLISRHPSLCPADAVHRNDPWRATPDDLMEDLTDCCDDELQQRFYETNAKDTLFSVAQRQLGQASRYVELLELNRFRIPADSDHQTLLPAGIQLLMPQQ